MSCTTPICIQTTVFSITTSHPKAFSGTNSSNVVNEDGGLLIVEHFGQYFLILVKVYICKFMFMQWRTDILVYECL